MDNDPSNDYRFEIRYGSKLASLEWEEMKGFLGKKFDSVEAKIDLQARDIRKEAVNMIQIQMKPECTCNELKQKIMALQKRVEAIEKNMDKLILTSDEKILFFKAESPQVDRGIYGEFDKLDFECREKRAKEFYASLWPY